METAVSQLTEKEEAPNIPPLVIQNSTKVNEIKSNAPNKGYTLTTSGQH